MFMRLNLLVASTLLTLVCSGIAATTSAQTPTTQQQRMVDCNKLASGKSGDDRKTFMSSCLKGQPTVPNAPMTQQQKMKACNADPQAKSLKGDARKSFMSHCLKGSAGAT